MQHDDHGIAVEQYTINGLDLTYNPDDERYYIMRGEDTLATFKDWRNALAYAKRGAS